VKMQYVHLSTLLLVLYETGTTLYFAVFFCQNLKLKVRVGVSRAAIMIRIKKAGRRRSVIVNNPAGRMSKSGFSYFCFREEMGRPMCGRSTWHVRIV
jgi:hypothetical protein